MRFSAQSCLRILTGVRVHARDMSIPLVTSLSDGVLLYTDICERIFEMVRGMVTGREGAEGCLRLEYRISDTEL